VVNRLTLNHGQYTPCQLEGLSVGDVDGGSSGGRRAACLGIATGFDEASYEPLHREGLIGYFAAAVTGGDVEPRKPDPEVLLECAAALGVEPPEAVYVGDTPLDIAAAKAAGMAAVAVLTGAGDSALLSRSGPDRIIASVALLPDLLEVP